MALSMSFLVSMTPCEQPTLERLLELRPPIERLWSAELWSP